MTELKITIRLELSEKLEDQIERLITTLVTAQNRWDDDDEEDFGDDDTAA